MCLRCRSALPALFPKGYPMLFDGFFGGRPPVGRFPRRTRPVLRRQERAFAPEALESRLALAYDVTTTVLTTSSFAYNITIDGQVDSNGYGRDIYLSRLDAGTKLVKIADNPAFNNATTLGLDVAGLGTCSTFYVTSGGNARTVRAALTPTTPTVIPIVALPTNDYVVTIADASSTTLPGVNPLSVSGRGSIDYTDPVTGTVYSGLNFTYQATALTAYGTATLTVTKGSGNWSGAGLTPSGEVTTRYSTISSSVVTGLIFQFVDSSSANALLSDMQVTNNPYKYFDPSPADPQSFTVAQGQNLDQRLIVDLPAVGSRISINNNWNAALGDNEGSIPGVDVDPDFYRGYDGVLNKGQIALYASEVSINQDISSVSRVAVGGPRNVYTRTGDLDNTLTDITNVSSLNYILPIGVGGGTFVAGGGFPSTTVVTALDFSTNTVSVSATPAVTKNSVSLKFIRPRPSGYISETSSLRFLGNVKSPSYSLEVTGTPPDHGEIFVSQAGSLKDST